METTVLAEDDAVRLARGILDTRLAMENHPYGQPTIMVHPIIGNKDFRAWVNGEISSG